MSEQLMVCKALAAMIRHHGETSEEEVTFVAHAAYELALTPEQNTEVQQVLRQGGDFDAAVAAITSRSMRHYFFRRLVAATLLDEVIEDHEIAMIEKTSAVFGFDEQVVVEYLDWMKEGIAWEKRGAALLARL